MRCASAKSSRPASAEWPPPNGSADAAFWKVNISPDGRTNLPRLHIITDDGVLARPNFRAVAGAIIEQHADRVALHLRGPRTSGAALYVVAAGLVTIAERAGATLLLNDRIDVALATGAHGVQLGARGISFGLARRLLGPDRWIGASVHSDHEANSAVAGGADFLIAGTLYPSSSHPERKGAGIDWLQSVTALEAPVIGIGGITPARASEIRRSGAHGAAALSGIWNAPEPLEAVQAYINELQ